MSKTAPNASVWPIDGIAGTRARDWLQLVWGAACVVPVVLVVAGVYTWLLPHAGLICPEQPLYLLSAIAQSLAAVVALVVSIPFAIAASSRFLSGAVPLASKTPVFMGFILFQILNIAAALLLLRANPMPSATLDLTLCTSIAALASLIPYVRWLVRRLDPLHHVDIIFGHCVDAIRSKGVPVTQDRLEALLEPAVNVAVESVTAGSVALVGRVSTRLWELYVDHNEEEKEETPHAHAALGGLRALAWTFPIHPNGASEVMEAAQLVFERAYGGIRPVSARVARGTAGLTIPIRDADPQCRQSPLTALVILWTLGGLAVLSDGRSNEALEVLSRYVAAWEVRSPNRKSLHECAHKMTVLWYERNEHPQLDSMRGALQKFGELVAGLDRRDSDAPSGSAADC